MKKHIKMIAMVVVLSVITVTIATGCAAVSAPAEDYSNGSAAEEPAQEPALDYDYEEARDESGEYAEEEAPPWADDSQDDFPVQKTNEEYEEYTESVFLSPLQYPLSTFSIDVDTASYSNIRRFLNDGALPPQDAVRVEECINYFTYNYDEPIGEHPIGVDVTISDCPWNAGRYLARVAVKAKELELSEAPDSNLVFLLDVSGSMNDPDKLPLVKSALIMLADNLGENDKVSIVVYAGASGVVLDGSKNKQQIEQALNSLSACGSTAGGEGIDLAYLMAEHHFIDGGNNRVILCTDGDFNVGPSSMEALKDLIEQKRSSGIFLSVLGFGEGNVKDNKMETLADKGNGNYAYIDSLIEAKKVLVAEMASTLYTIAKDVKIQVEFNPSAVSEYRLVGYDNRRLKAEDFNDDKKDAGEMGAGHTVTVFYEIILVGGETSADIDPLVFQQDDTDNKAVQPSDDWLFVKTRYKEPEQNTSKLMTVLAGKSDYTQTPDTDYLYASAVAEFALLLKDSEYAGDASYERLIERARMSKGQDENGYRAQFIQLAELAAMLRR